MKLKKKKKWFWDSLKFLYDDESCFFGGFEDNGEKWSGIII